MRRTPLVVAGLTLALLPSATAAQLYDGPPLDAQEYLQFVGAGDAVVATWGGVYLGPYEGSFLTPTTPTFSLYCVDYTHHATSQWVDVTQLSGGADFGSTRLGSFETYRHTAYLSSLFDSWQTLGDDKRTVWSGIHAAIWSLTNDQDLGSGETLAVRDLLLTDPFHLAGAASFETDGWYVLSPGTEPYGGRDGQEFLIRAQSTVPEPSTYLLMGTGLLLLAAFSRKRRFAPSVDEA
jgi:hypothetical protein